MLLLVVVHAEAAQYADIGLRGRVPASDVVVLARIIDPALALVSVERVLKGDAPKQLRLVDYVTRWKQDTAVVSNVWPHDAGLMSNAVVAWRLRQAAPVFAATLEASRDGERRAFAAIALGGTGDRAYLPQLREVAASDSHARARLHTAGS